MLHIFPKVASKLFHFILACILFIGIILQIFVTLTVFVPLRTFVRLIARLFRPDLLSIVTGPSALFAGDSIATKPQANIIGIPVFDGPTDLQKLRSIFQQRVLEHRRPNGKFMYPEFKQYWTGFLSFFFWVKDESFDLKEHIRLYDYGNDNEEKELILDEVQKGFCDEGDLSRLLGPLLQQPWRQGKSPWEFLLIPHFKSSREEMTETLGSAVICRLHHTLGDGYSFLKILHRWMGVEYPEPLANFRKRGLLHKFLFTTFLPFKVPWDIAASLMQTFDGQHCWTRNGWDTSRKHSVWTSMSKPIDVQLIKNIKNKYGVSYNAVLSAAAAGSCMKLMEDAGQIIPKKVACFTPYPLPRHPDGLVNHVTSFTLGWPMDSSKSREKRLRMMSERMAISAYNTLPIGNKFLGDLAALLPTALLEFPIRSAAITVVASSLPGTREVLTANGLGTKMFDLIACIGPGLGAGGATMLFLSSNGKQRLLNCIDSSVFPSRVMAANFGKYVEGELLALWNGKTINEEDLTID